MDRSSPPSTGLTPGQGAMDRTAIGAGRNLAASLDSLVRSIRTNPGTVPMLIERTLGYWKESEHAALEFLPTGMQFGGNDVFDADEEEGRWLLPAFMAGLRALRPWTDISPIHLEALASELADLSGSVEEIDCFRDWLWADGAEGFDVSLDLSFSEGIDTAFDDLDVRRSDLAAVRVEAAQAVTTRAQRIGSGALDVAAALPEFQVDPGAYETLADSGAFFIPAEERGRLQGLCGDPNFWGEAEADVVLQHPALQKGIPALRLADLLMREFAKAADVRVVGLLTRLGNRQDAYARSLLAALEGDTLGRRIATAAPMTNQGVRAVASLVLSGPLPIARGAARGFIERAVNDREAFAAMKQIASSVVFPRFCELLDPEDLDMETMTTLGLLILRSKDPPRLMPRFFDAVPPQVALSVLGQAPQQLLWEARTAAGKLLIGAADSDRRRQLVRIILGTGEDRWLPVLGRALRQTGGKGWCPATLKVTCDRLHVGGLGAEVLVPLVRDAGATDDAVLAALRALERNTDALKEATKFHFRELTHSKDVRQRLRKLRKHLREEG
ncbi:MAG: hypothetical protein ABIK09_09685 [Pseudomonadota bacterium]